MPGDAYASPGIFNSQCTDSLNGTGMFTSQLTYNLDVICSDRHLTALLPIMSGYLSTRQANFARMISSAVIP
jgi:hypothetical protein